MSDITDGGGPAFPYVYIPRPDLAPGVLQTVTSGGMTMRDYFAAKAPAPPSWWMKSYAENAQDLDTVAETLAQWNYAYADAMLKERQP